MSKVSKIQISIFLCQKIKLLTAICDSNKILKNQFSLVFFLTFFCEFSVKYVKKKPINQIIDFLQKIAKS
jgi:hypothetical protein